MTPTKHALRVLNTHRLTQAERNAVIELATRLAKERDCREVVPAWFVRDAIHQLKGNRHARTI